MKSNAIAYGKLFLDTTTSLTRKTLFYTKLINLVYTLEDHLQEDLAILSCRPAHFHIQPESRDYSSILDFYRSTPIHPKQIKFSSLSIERQIKEGLLKNKLVRDTQPNPFSPLLPTYEHSPPTIGNSSSPKKHLTISHQTCIMLVNDTDLSALTTIIAQQLTKDQEHTQSTSSQQESLAVHEPEAINQWIRFNLIRHRGVVGNLSTLKLFKSFVNELKAADSSLAVLPFRASKQHYSALTHTKQINTVEENRMYQYFRPYYKNSTTLSADIFTLVQPYHSMNSEISPK